MQSPMGDPIVVHLDALRTPMAVHVSGKGAKSLSKSLSAAWEWCLAGPRMGSRNALRIDAVLDDDPAVLESALALGAVVGSDVREIMHRLTPAITTAAITHQAGSLLMLHACALAHPRTGAVVVLVGPSGIGKTTVAKTLGSSLAYITDETAAILENLAVVPFPKPLSVLQVADDAVKDQISPAALGLSPPPERPMLSAVVLLDRHPAAPAVPTLKRIPTVHALALLAPETSFLARMKAPLRQMAGLLNATRGLQRLTYRDADHLPEVVHDLLDRF